MATSETWVLDGVTLTAGGNFDILELTADPPKARPDWIAAADSEGAALMRRPLHENRTVTLKMRITQQASMNAALDQIGVILDKLRLASGNADGIALTWTPANATRTVTFDVLEGEISELPIGLDGHAWSWFKQRPIFTLELVCKPYWRGTETTVASTSSTNPVVTQQIGPIPGDIPALGRLIVTDLSTQTRRHVEWGLENPDTYNSGTSLLLDSDSLVTTGFAGVGATRAGAYDPGAAGSSVVRGTFYQSTYTGPQAYCGTGVQAHVGAFLVKARIYSTTLTGSLRLSWQYGDGTFRANPWVYPSGANAWTEIELGPITIPALPSGTQRWSGRVEGTGPTGETVDIDYLTLIPLDAGYGKARGPFVYNAGSVVGRDEWTGTTAGGTLNTRVAPSGGTWATGGSANDFGFADAPSGQETVFRQSTADTSPGRYAILGATNYTDTEVGVQFQRTSYYFPAATTKMGATARWVDASNYLHAYVRQWEGGQTSDELYLDRIITGTATTIGRSGPFATMAPNNWYAIRMVVFASGMYSIVLLDSPGNLLARINGTDANLATGGTLATGKPGFIDYNPTGTVYQRYYDFFYAATPGVEPVAMYSGRQLEVRYNDTLRQDSTGVYYGRPPAYRGSRFLVPPGTSRVLVKARRFDVELAQDEFIADNTQIQVAYTPRGLAVPR